MADFDFDPENIFEAKASAEARFEALDKIVLAMLHSMCGDQAWAARFTSNLRNVADHLQKENAHEDEVFLLRTRADFVEKTAAKRSARR